MTLRAVVLCLRMDKLWADNFFGMGQTEACFPYTWLMCSDPLCSPQGVCMEAGMYALRERRVHVTQEDFEMAVSKIMQKDSEKNVSLKKFWK